MLHKIIKITCGVLFLVHTVWADSIKPVTIQQETAKYIIDIKYPQGFVEDNVNTVLKQYIATTQKSFFNELSEDDDTPADAPGKTGLNVTYSILYNTKAALSVRFDVSIFHKGAAHPLNTVVVHNFLNGKNVELSDVFQPKSNYLQVIAAFCKKAIAAKNISDPKWIEEGTKPTLENYNTWYFKKEGIGILFNTYQVAAYVYGVQKVTIPVSVISSIVKPALLKTLWGN